ncbi:MAG: hypothetical protein IT384_33715 [Deltaproteobacteria bacterium]|nr:hypothetical protein [Deltaproteobacteria bacterium]
MKRANATGSEPKLADSVRASARARLRDLIASERNRARLHIGMIRRSEPNASRDRVANVILERLIRAASLEGGLTGALGFLGVPLNLVAFAYLEIALVVAVAEAYDVPLEGPAGEDALLGVLGKAHGVEDVLRSTPRVLGAIAKTLALRHGFLTLGRLVPLVASPIAARLNQRAMDRTATEALRRFGNVVRIA